LARPEDGARVIRSFIDNLSERRCTS
jgi:hypothetical protein